MHVLATYNIKGGVGKTAAAVNLAYLAAAEGARTLVWDLDPQGAATWYLRTTARVYGGGRSALRGQGALGDLVQLTQYANLDVLPADFSYRHLDLVLDESKKPTRRLAKLVAPLASSASSSTASGGSGWPCCPSSPWSTGARAFTVSCATSWPAAGRRC